MWGVLIQALVSYLVAHPAEIEQLVTALVKRITEELNKGVQA